MVAISTETNKTTETSQTSDTSTNNPIFVIGILIATTIVILTLLSLAIRNTLRSRYPNFNFWRRRY